MIIYAHFGAAEQAVTTALTYHRLAKRIKRNIKLFDKVSI